MIPTWLKETKNGIAISVRVTPRAKLTKVISFDGPSLKVSLQAPPVEGAANEALIKFLSKTLAIPKSRIELIRGQSSREKVVALQDVQKEKVIDALCSQSST